ncbi:MAG TPA: hypothetical protein VNZ64_15085 [Candidatus Acidoferrum sp.]|nr:hypothetical protein [Candidatus Acidoferrum sp.]
MIWFLAASPTRAASPDAPPDAARFGRVHFPITATPAAQAQFDRAVAMLHSFWYEELDREFGKVLELDPNCAMGYWGLAMALWHPLWEPPDTNTLSAGLAAVEKGRRVGAKTPREQAYLDAIGAFYADYQNLEHGARSLRYSGAMEKLHQLYPADNDATAFYALALLATASPGDRAFTNQLRAATLLQQVAAVQTNHPGVVHYLIHAYDTPSLAARGLPEAVCYSQIAPAIPHALHMPSHIYTRLGLWQESIQANLASEAAASNYAAQVKMAGTWDEQLHAMDYLMYAYLQTAQDHAAERLVAGLRNINQAAPRNFKAGYALAAIPARYLLERRQWAEAARLELAPQDFPWANQAWPWALNRFARCLGAARAGNSADARKELESLSRMRPAETGVAPSYRVRQIDILYAEARAWTAHAEHQDEDALRWMRQAADQEDAIEKKPVTPGPLVPARELLGDLLLESGQPREALAEFGKSLKESPKRFNGLYGAARAAAALGDSARARDYFHQLLTSCQHADSQRPELLAAKQGLDQR